MRSGFRNLAIVLGVLAFLLQPLAGFSASEPTPTVKITTVLPVDTNVTPDRAYMASPVGVPAKVGFGREFTDEPTAREECILSGPTNEWTLSPANSAVKLLSTNDAATTLSVSNGAYGEYNLNVTVKWLEKAKDGVAPPESPRGEISCSTNLILSILKVELLVNDTEAETDDYVVKQKPAGVRESPISGTPGATDNHIQLKVRLLGSLGSSCKVNLSDTGGGDIAIKMNENDSDYPADGVTMMVGADLAVKMFGVSESSAKNDVRIIAKTDKTGEAVCGDEDLTVVWIAQGDIVFRGTDNQGKPFHEKSEATLNYPEYFVRKCGNIKGGNQGENSTPVWWIVSQEEVRFKVTPDVFFGEDLQWRIKREGSAKNWSTVSGDIVTTYPITEQNTGKSTPESDWANDSPIDHGSGMDIHQNEDCSLLFSMDSPGWQDPSGQPVVSNARKTRKMKAREWVEIRFGGKWYVCSSYVEWIHLLHVVYNGDVLGWDFDNTKTNYIKTGTFDGFSVDWTDEP